jgi:hypothetical protein
MTTENTSSVASVQSIVTPSRIRRLRKCVETIECYGHFREGQDGFQALLEMRQFVDELDGKLSPYGYCPHCGNAGIKRERRPDGNDTCESGHVYPSRCAR